MIPWFTIRGWRIPVPGLDHIQPFGAIVLFGVVMGTLVTLGRARRAGLPRRVMLDCILHVVAIGFVVSHFFDVVVYYPRAFLADPMVAVRNAGTMSAFGGFFGSVVGAWLWKFRTGGSIVAVTDFIAFGFPLGFGIGRVGCFLVHDHPGVVTTFPLAVADYQVGRPPYLPRHDLGLYDALVCAALFVLFLVLGRRPRRPGLYLGLLPTLYAVPRFFLDSLRESPERGGDVRYFGLTPGQYSAVVLAALGIGVLVRVFRPAK